MRALTLFFGIFVLPLSLAQGQGLEGRWLSEEWDGVRSVIEITVCEQGVCGTIVGAEGEDLPEDRLGHRLFWGFEARGDGTFSKGKLKPPGGAPQLSASIEDLSAERLVIRGCLLLICRNETLIRL